MTVHPAQPLIREAEGTPAFQFAHARITDLLSVASQTDPTALAPEWITRLALRFADVLLQTGALDRARTWLGTAETHGAALPGAAADHALLSARLALRSGADAPTVDRALAAAHAALAAAAQGPAPLTPAQRQIRATRLQIVTAEHHFARARYQPIPALLAERIHQPGAFGSVDDLWRAHRLLAMATQAVLDLETAADHFLSAADLCETHAAPRDRAEALIGLAQCLLGLGAFDRARACLRDAQGLVAPGEHTFKTATGALISTLLSAGDLPAALDAAARAATQAAAADDHAGYLQIVGVITQLRRLAGQHETAYRELLTIYSQLTARLGPPAAAPILPLLDALRRDLGDPAFEALSARLLQERSP